LSLIFSNLAQIDADQNVDKRGSVISENQRGNQRKSAFEEISEGPLREIKNRLKFMIDVGLEYLTLDRKAGTLSGGESQRIRLASQIGFFLKSLNKKLFSTSV